MPIFFEIEGPDMPWGDYGDMLFHGMNDNDPDDPPFPVKLQRTGPYVPDITRPWGYLVVTDRVKQALEQTQFDGIAFEDVVLDRIVDLKWHEWDRSKEDPRRYPADGEPDNYIIRRKHSDKAAAQLSKLWALNVPKTANPLALTTIAEEGFDPGIDIFQSAWEFYVTPNLMNWLRDIAPDCVSFSHPLWLLEPKKPPELMRHFKVRAEIEQVGDHETWGALEYYLELDDEDAVVRQIQCYENGNSLKYPGRAGMQIEDAHGGLGEDPVPSKTRQQNDFTEISAEEFERVWKASGVVYGLRQWSYDEFDDELDD